MSLPILKDHLRAIEYWEPKIHALVDWNVEAAERRAALKSTGPLAGWSIGVKDILDLAGTPTRCGVKFLSSDPKPISAKVITALEDQGAHALAKTATTCFAYLDPGPTRNPWNLNHTPGGSSMGSAAAVAVGMLRAAIGTQTVGSICRPASFCGVVGYKPSFGLLPTEGCFALAPTFDTIGFFTRNVDDMTTLSSAFVSQEPTTPVRPPVIGVIKDLLFGPMDDEMAATLDWAVAQLESAGVQTVPLVIPKDFDVVYDNNKVIFAVEAMRSHSKLWPHYRDAYPPKLKEILTSTDHEYFAENDSIRTKNNVQYVNACSDRRKAQSRFEALFDGIDVVLTHAALGPAPRDLTQTGDPRANLLFTHVRAPVISLPAKLSDDGMPLGLQCAGPSGTDATVLSASRVIEDILQFDKVPPHA